MVESKKPPKTVLRLVTRARAPSSMSKAPATSTIRAPGM